jgi:4a-hydroxytetrahydrobiopterin dehydratase
MSTPDITDPKRRLTSAEVDQLGLDDWRILFATLHARFATGDFATGLELVNRVGAEAEAMNHHPDIDLSYPSVRIRLTSHDTGGVTGRDVRLARRTSEIAAELGVSAEPADLAVLELGLDTPDLAAIKPFWQALLGMRDTAEPEELVDPRGVMPTIWFQESDPHDEPHQRWHLDIRIPPEVAEERIAAALAAGGTLVTDEHAPAFTVLADAQGNKACVCTWRGRTH